MDIQYMYCTDRFLDHEDKHHKNCDNNIYHNASFNDQDNNYQDHTNIHCDHDNFHKDNHHDSGP